MQALARCEFGRRSLPGSAVPGRAWDREKLQLHRKVNMKDDPFIVLDLPDDASDEAIRQRYLDLVRQYTPEHNPERFAAIRAAYDSLRDQNTRLRRLLFGSERGELLQPLLEELSCRSPSRR